jgi:primary-amine oxidase
MLTLTNRRTAVGFIIVCLALMLSATRGDAAQNSPCLPATTTALEMNQLIYQEFPARGPTETAWKIVWSEHPARGLWIENAWFTPKPNAPAILVLGQSGLSNIFVPYHDGLPREYDLNPYTVLREAVLAYTGPCGTISGPALPDPSLANPNKYSSPRPVLIKEIRDRGVAWTSDGRLHRGEELLLWGVIDTGNYEYIVQYGFRDDGTITFRMGSTGYNYPTNAYMAYQPHMHNALWYLDIDLGHAANNSVTVMSHLEPPWSLDPGQAGDVMEQINNGFEGFADWRPEEFTGLNIIDTLTMNARGHNISYDLMPMRTGTARHNELFTKHDFWVTHQNGNELTYEWGFGPGLPYMPYFSPPPLQPESITNTNVVIWCISSNHHSPRDEDQEVDAQGNWKSGIAQVMWSGFDLQPRNLMDDAPLFGCAKVPASIVAWWPFEEVAGVTCIVDISGQTNNGTPHPGPLGPTTLIDPPSSHPTWTGPITVSGAVGGALSFDGAGDYVEVPDSASLNFGLGDFSADAWIKSSPISSGQTSVILDKRVPVPPTYQGYSLYLDHTGKLGLQLGDGVHPFVNYISNANVADGYWHQFAVTVNRTGNPKEILWYVDGNLVDTTPAPLAGDLTNASPLRLGSRSFVLGGYLKAVLGETELFSGVLTGAQIHDIYAAGKCRPPGPPPPCPCLLCQ